MNRPAGPNNGGGNSGYNANSNSNSNSNINRGGPAPRNGNANANSNNQRNNNSNTGQNNNAPVMPPGMQPGAGRANNMPWLLNALQNNMNVLKGNLARLKRKRNNNSIK